MDGHGLDLKFFNENNNNVDDNNEKNRYLANDFQLYSFAPILLIALYKYVRAGNVFEIKNTNYFLNRYKLGGILLGAFAIAATSAIHLAITIEKVLHIFF